MLGAVRSVTTAISDGFGRYADQVRACHSGQRDRDLRLVVGGQLGDTRLPHESSLGEIDTPVDQVANRRLRPD